MEFKYDYYQKHLEWEYLEENQEISFLSFQSNQYNIGKESIITFKRDEKYDLVATITGILTNQSEIERADDVAGTFINDESVTGYSSDGMWKYIFSGIVIGSVSYTPISITPISSKFIAEFLFDKVERIYWEKNGDFDKIQEWYLSGKIDVRFPRKTKRSFKYSILRTRDEIQEEKDKPMVGSWGSSNDYLLVKYLDYSFIVSKVPPEYGPSWANNLSIEYSITLGGIPPVKERIAISEFIGFIFGNQLLKIGHTCYDKKENVLSQEYLHPWGNNVVSKSQRTANPPIGLKSPGNSLYIESIITSLLPHYMNLQTTLHLNDVLWKLWIARDSSIGVNLPILSSALETLASNVIKLNGLDNFYLEYNYYNAIIKHELDVINKKLGDNPYKEIILNKIKGAAQRGGNEKLELLFTILKLPINTIEKKALKARNRMAHSSNNDTTEEQMKDTIRLTHAYETLLHRVILKLMRYEDEYIDYYNFGHPQKMIDEPI